MGEGRREKIQVKGRGLERERGNLKAESGRGKRQGRRVDMERD